MKSDHRYKYAAEKFPTGDDLSFKKLFDLHAMEVRETKFRLNWYRYRRIEEENRLIWIVARNTGDGTPVGYSGHYWYLSLHFEGDKIAQDDLWFVSPDHRGNGVGRHLKEIGLSHLGAIGVLETSDFIRNAGTHPALMTQLGYTAHGIWWKKSL